LSRINTGGVKLIIPLTRIGIRVVNVRVPMKRADIHGVSFKVALYELALLM